MASCLAGIDPHQSTFTISVIDVSFVEVEIASLANSGAGYGAAIDMLSRHGVEVIGVEGSASWGAHVAIALAAAGFDVREVPAQRAALQRRGRRNDKTDRHDALAIARALAAEPTLGPAQALEIYDSVVAEIEAVIEHRRMLVAERDIALHHIADQLAKLPTDIRDRLGTAGKIEARIRRLDKLNLNTTATTRAGTYRLSWLRQTAAQDRARGRAIRALEARLDTLLDEHGTTLREQPGIGTVIAATLLVEVGDPNRFASEAKFARWCGAAAVALSSGEGNGKPVRHRLDRGGNRRVNSVLHIMSVTQQRAHHDGATYLDRKVHEGKTRREARRAHKRHLANTIIRCLWKDETTRHTT